MFLNFGKRKEVPGHSEYDTILLYQYFSYLLIIMSIASPSIFNRIASGILLSLRKITGAKPESVVVDWKITL